MPTDLPTVAKHVEFTIDSFISDISDNSKLPNGVEHNSRQWGLTVCLSALRCYCVGDASLNFDEALSVALLLSREILLLSEEEFDRMASHASA